MVDLKHEMYSSKYTKNKACPSSRTTYSIKQGAPSMLGTMLDMCRLNKDRASASETLREFQGTSKSPWILVSVSTVEQSPILLSVFCSK